MRAARFAAGIIATALLVAGCAQGSEPDTAPGEKQVVETLRALPFGDAQVNAVAELFGTVGVGVHEDGDLVHSGKPVRVTRWQLRNLALEAANGGGIPGETLNALAPVAKGAPPLAYLLGAWVKTYDSPGARFARELMGETDWSAAANLHFPGLVLTLFLADATAGMKSTTKAMALVANVGGVCTAIAGFIQHGIADVANALKVDTSGGGFLGFLGVIWNTAIELAAAAVQGLVDRFAKPAIDLMADVFGVVAVIAQVSSILRKWRAEFTAQPTHTQFGVDGQEVNGAFNFMVREDQVPIPETILDCADAVKVDLRSAGAAAGSKLDWRDRSTGPVGLASRVRADAALKPDKSAQFTYRTSSEPSELAKSPETETFAYVVTVTAHRSDVARAKQLFERLLLDQLPAGLRGIVEGLTARIRNAAEEKLRSLTDFTATGRGVRDVSRAAQEDTGSRQAGWGCRDPGQVPEGVP